jgi:tungstate transport system substrate-binding protein
VVLLVHVIVLVPILGCLGPDEKTASLTLATTTSARDSGLLDVLLPQFEKETGIAVKVIAVGSGQTLELGRRGDADVLLTHAPEAEEQFMAEGYGDLRRNVMFNDFVLLGPQHDPAQVQGQASIVEAFRRIAAAGAPFVSRGDESGTHMKERAVWEQAAVEPEGDWYLQAGVGMAAVLRMASEKGGYTLADRGTFLAQRADLDLVLVSEGDPLLRNPYAVLVVSAKKHPGVDAQAATRFCEFLLSPAVQRTIGEFGVDRFGQPLFSPWPDP